MSSSSHDQAVPSARQRIPVAEPPKPSVVRAWLAEVAREEPADRTDRLTEILDTLRRSTLPPELRFRSAEICREEVARLRHDLDLLLAGLSLPLHPDKEKLSRKCADTHWLLANCYMRVATELASRHKPVRSDATYLPRSCYWGMASLGEHLLINYECYAKARQGSWLKIHKLYNIARAEGVHDTTVESDSGPARTVEHIYKRLLLLGLSDPYRYPFRGLGRIYENLEEWASLASLTTTAENSGRCLFTVDPALDRPAMPALPRSRIRPEVNEKWLVTRQLVDKLKQEHEKAVKDAALRHDNPSAITAELDSLELLRRVIVHWGLHPIRANARTPIYKTCEVVVGLKQVCAALNGFQSVRVETRGSMTTFMNMIKGTFSSAPESIDGARITNHWEIADESERGLRIIAGDDKGIGRISVGELIAFRSGTGADWTLGHVHWAQAGHDKRLSLGIRRIGVGAQPVLIGRLQTGTPPGGAGDPALLLVTETRSGRTVSLLCAKNLYFPTGTYLVHQVLDGGERVIEATNVILSTRSFVWFEVCKPQANTKQRTLDLIYPR